MKKLHGKPFIGELLMQTSDTNTSKEAIRNLLLIVRARSEEQGPASQNNDREEKVLPQLS